jgi:hypothetical protein
LLAWSLPIPAHVSSISGELMKFNYGHSMLGFFHYMCGLPGHPRCEQMVQTGIAVSSGVTSVPMCFVHLPPACGPGVMQGRMGLLAALAMPPTMGSRFEVCYSIHCFTMQSVSYSKRDFDIFWPGCCDITISSSFYHFLYYKCITLAILRHKHETHFIGCTKCGSKGFLEKSKVLVKGHTK